MTNQATLRQDDREARARECLAEAVGLASGSFATHHTDDSEITVEQAVTAMLAFIASPSPAVGAELRTAEIAVREEIVRQYRDDDRGRCAAGSAFWEENVQPRLIAQVALAAFADQERPSPDDAPCELCAGKCRGHSFGHPEQWEPEPGSAAYATPSPGVDEGLRLAAQRAIDSACLVTNDGDDYYCWLPEDREPLRAALATTPAAGAEVPTWPKYDVCRHCSDGSNAGVTCKVCEGRGHVPFKPTPAPAAVPDDVREQIARIITPGAAWEAYPVHVSDFAADALAKADTILALVNRPGTTVGGDQEPTITIHGCNCPEGVEVICDIAHCPRTLANASDAVGP